MELHLMNLIHFAPVNGWINQIGKLLVLDYFRSRQIRGFGQNEKTLILKTV
jgi:hypothetical protein